MAENCWGIDLNDPLPPITPTESEYEVIYDEPKAVFVSEACEVHIAGWSI